jgi:L-ascorbate metabolism protein UlaG (beta-lactamase superfamily)
LRKENAMSTEITFLGHNAWSIRAGQHRLLLDPFLNDNPLSPCKAEQVEADYILVSHGHGDHLGDAVAIAARTGATAIGIFEVCQWLSAQGVKNVHAMNLGGGYEFPFGRLTMTLALHSSSMPDGTYAGNPCGYVLAREGRRAYFACDTALFSDMKLIGAAGLDLAALPIGDNYTMGPDDALEAVRLLKPRRVVPIHVGTWPVIAQDAEAWARRVHTETGAEAIVLKPGGKVEL